MWVNDNYVKVFKIGYYDVGKDGSIAKIYR